MDLGRFLPPSPSDGLRPWVVLPCRKGLMLKKLRPGHLYYLLLAAALAALAVDVWFVCKTVEVGCKCAIAGQPVGGLVGAITAELSIVVPLLWFGAEMAGRAIEVSSSNRSSSRGGRGPRTAQRGRKRAATRIRRGISDAARILSRSGKPLTPRHLRARLIRTRRLSETEWRCFSPTSRSPSREKWSR